MGWTTKEIPLAILAGIVCLGIPTPVRAQQSCVAPPPASLAPAPGTNIFTPQQEVDLGDIQAERIERDVRVIHDDELAAYLNRLAQRLLAKMPSTGLQFRVTLIDLPAINAFTLPGGRIYVTRKMVASVHGEDELAAMLGHEMGHALTHQAAIDTTRLFREVLGVTSVGDRKDIFDKWNLLLDNVARNVKIFQKTSGEEEPHQYEADEVALYALANAGYSVQTFADFFDRLTQTNGKTGGWLTDIFGNTTPNEKRLREVQKAIGDLPAACRLPVSTSASPEFLDWQGRVIAYSGLGWKEVLSGVIEKRALDPPLRNDVKRLRFSSDGRYVLAQDDSSIFVMSHDPFRLLFRVDAPDAQAAQFTPDSTGLVFSTRGLRVEEWNLEDQSQTNIHELTLPEGCIQSQLSPDGKTLACLNASFDVSLIDVATESVVFEKKKFFEPPVGPAHQQVFRTLIRFLEAREGELFHMEFSPDGRYFVAGGLRTSVAFDLVNHSPASTHGGLSERMGVNFVFLAPDKVLAADPFDVKESGVFEFPSGLRLQSFPLGEKLRVEALTRSPGNAVVTSLKDAPAAVVDLKAAKVVLALKLNSAVDVYDQQFVVELASGALGLYEMGIGKFVAGITLPQSPLGRLDAAGLSDDLQWIALSGTTRGAVWNLSTAKRFYYTRGFRGAYFDGDQALYAEFPKWDQQERAIARADLDRNNMVTATPLEEQSVIRQWGRYLMERKPGGKDLRLNRNIVVDLRDARDGHELWTRTFPKEAPGMFPQTRSGTCLLEWPLEDEAAMDEIKGDSGLRERLASLRDRKGAYLVEVVDLSTGKPLGAFIIDTGKGSFRIVSASAAGDWVTIGDTDGRIRIYQLSTGEPKGVVLGAQFASSPTGSLISVASQPGELDIYRIPSLEKLGQLTFSSLIVVQTFSQDGKRLCVLTADQTVRVFDTDAIGTPKAPAEVAQGAAK